MSENWHQPLKNKNREKWSRLVRNFFLQMSFLQINIKDVCILLGPLCSYRNGLHLDKQLVPDKSAHLNGRACRRVGQVNVFVPDTPDHWHQGDVRQEKGQLHHMPEVNGSGLQGVSDILENLFGLGGQVTCSDNFPCRV
ncbi:hypothetical protein D3C81_1686230 [compost metagenome]